MAAKLGRYIFKRIRGRVVPIRVGLEVANKHISRLADSVVAYNQTKYRALARKAFKSKEPSSFKKFLESQRIEVVGKGVDFKVFSDPTKRSHVIKIPNGGMGTGNKRFSEAFPLTADKLAVSRVLGENLPNYGIATVESQIIRLSRKKRGLLQEFQEKPASLFGSNHYVREAEKIKLDYGLDLDPHSGNVNKFGAFIDTAASLRRSSIRKVKQSDAAKELLGIEGQWNAKLSDHFNKSEVITESVAVESASRAILRKMKSLHKKGFRLKADGPDTLKLVSPAERVEGAKAKGIKFMKKNGVMKIVRGDG